MRTEIMTRSAASSTDFDFVLASLNPPKCWNLYETMEAAQADMPRANAYDAQWQYQPMTWDAFVQGRRAVYLTDPPVQITADKFHKMLEILPPMAWKSGFDFESFLMCEYFSVPFTHQYARLGHGENETYWTRLVDASDRSTWMTAESLRGAVRMQAAKDAGLKCYAVSLRTSSGAGCTWNRFAADDEIAARDAREAAQRESMQFVCIRLLTDEETAKVFNGTAVAV